MKKANLSKISSIEIKEGILLYYSQLFIKRVKTDQNLQFKVGYVTIYKIAHKIKKLNEEWINFTLLIY